MNRLVPWKPFPLQRRKCHELLTRNSVGPRGLRKIALRGDPVCLWRSAPWRSTTIWHVQCFAVDYLLVTSLVLEGAKKCQVCSLTVVNESLPERKTI
eukprot:COSAG06_NODE_45796_length_352_cov_0.608696_1_plen_96_part_01